MEERKIIHVDMDAFYAAVEMRDHPEWRNLPLVVGRNPRQTGGRGVVATANYHARRYGIHSAMSTQKAWELCPHAVFKQPNSKIVTTNSCNARSMLFKCELRV